MLFSYIIFCGLNFHIFISFIRSNLVKTKERRFIVLYVTLFISEIEKKEKSDGDNFKSGNIMRYIVISKKKQTEGNP